MHLNVLHHAGHDFDADLIISGDHTICAEYAVDYFRVLRERANRMLFQMGSNWGGDKNLPIVGEREDAEKLRIFDTWLEAGGWQPLAVAYSQKREDGGVNYKNISDQALKKLRTFGELATDIYDWHLLNDFPGEFYRRPLFHYTSR